MTSASSATPSQDVAGALSSSDRTRAAALRCLATCGAQGTSLRMVADAAGVSIGLIQHHFDAKAGLIQAVDDHVITVIDEAMAAPLPPPPEDPVAAMGQRVTSLIGQHPDVVDYLARAYIEGNAIASALFDRSVAIGTAMWGQLRENHRTWPELDPTWAALNPIILALGAFILRPHIDRHLPEPFSTPTQLRRWENAVNGLIRAGQLRRPPEPSR